MLDLQSATEALLQEKPMFGKAKIPQLSQSISQPANQASWGGPSNAKSLLTTRSNCTSLALRRGAGAI